MRVIYHPAAEAELIASAQFYEQQASGLGADSLEAIDQAILKIQDAPNRWNGVEKDVRRYLMRRFPYGVYYRLVSADEVRILAFKHHSRHPGYWRDRLAE